VGFCNGVHTHQHTMTAGRAQVWVLDSVISSVRADAGGDVERYTIHRNPPASCSVSFGVFAMELFSFLFDLCTGVVYL
jgi:hypothetical protein